MFQNHHGIEAAGVFGLRTQSPSTLGWLPERRPAFSSYVDAHELLRGLFLQFCNRLIPRWLILRSDALLNGRID
jgi:hypothetical protein